ncbi:MAG TPA: dihydrofolate reductase family protein [Devosia sp.]|nr:dihydrofolate reductase family protein [Devosia sp.]
MGKLVYGMGGVSLDGYVTDLAGDFNWAMPGVDLHNHAGAMQAEASAIVYGRKMYDMMVFWETADQLPDMSASGVEYAKNWRVAEKIVVSNTLLEPKSIRTRIVQTFSADDMRKLKAASSKPVMVAGPTTASPYLNEGLVDEVTGYFLPIIIGSGLPMFKDLAHPIKLKQTEEQPLVNGFVFRRYAVLN